MKVRLGNKEFNIVYCKNYLTGMMGKGFDGFDGMVFRIKGAVHMALCIPMDIVYMKGGKVVDIVEAQPLTSNPNTWKTYHTDKEYSYFIEFKKGMGIKIGDEIEQLD